MRRERGTINAVVRGDRYRKEHHGNATRRDRSGSHPVFERCTNISLISVRMCPWKVTGGHREGMSILPNALGLRRYGWQGDRSKKNRDIIEVATYVLRRQDQIRNAFVVRCPKCGNGVVPSSTRLELAIREIDASESGSIARLAGSVSPQKLLQNREKKPI